MPSEIDKISERLEEALALLKRQYCAMIKPSWYEGESEDEILSATNNFLSNILGEDWEDYKRDLYQRTWGSRKI